jgi:hypothetical protein
MNPITAATWALRLLIGLPVGFFLFCIVQPSQRVEGPQLVPDIPPGFILFPVLWIVGLGLSIYSTYSDHSHKKRAQIVCALYWLPVVLVGGGYYIFFLLK